MSTGRSATRASLTAADGAALRTPSCFAPGALLLLSAALASTSCGQGRDRGGGEPARVEVDADPSAGAGAGAEAGPRAAPDAAPPPMAAAEAPFIWYEAHPGPVHGGLGGIGISTAVEVPIVGSPRRYVVEPADAGLRVRRLGPDGAEAWATAVPAVGAGAPVLFYSISEGVFVAAPIDDRYLVARVDMESGALLSRAEGPPLDGTGPLRIQLGQHREHLAVYLRRDSSAAVDVVAMDGGALVGRAVVAAGDVGRPRPTATPGGRPRTRGPHPALDGGRYTTARAVPEPGSETAKRVLARHIGLAPPPRTLDPIVRLTRLGPDGARLWAADIDDGGPFATSTLLEEGDDLVFVAAYCDGATGASLVALDRTTGERRWSAAPYGIGSIGHSRYSNDVRLAVEADRVVLEGLESSGDYVALFDRATGRLVSNVVWRR